MIILQDIAGNSQCITSNRIDKLLKNPTHDKTGQKTCRITYTSGCDVAKMNQNKQPFGIKACIAKEFQRVFKHFSSLKTLGLWPVKSLQYLSVNTSTVDLNRKFLLNHKK